MQHKPNRLINAKSPYLLQHAYNPVEWYEWSDEAFERAKSEDKPVFLSIGYSTCHWCHVMQHQSFEDEEVADLMNAHFINIKLDREEHPDIDAVYMSACQMVTGGGGWPLTVIMTPDKRPFFLGTYFPKESKQNRVGMIDLIPRIMEIWDENRDEITNSAEEIIKHLKASTEFPFGKAPEESLLHKAFEQLQSAYDAQFGGFGKAPKFPTPHNLLFLLRYAHHAKNEHALQMAEKTLTEMRFGGIFDHLGKGFHRYSTDRQWLLPHFEKMLYDQAMLMLAYTEAYAVTGKSVYRDTVNDIFTYVNSKLTSPEGAFFCAEDADSEGVEGKFYVWQADELRALLGSDYDVVSSYFNVSNSGNFTDPFQHMSPNSNILYVRPEQDAQLGNEQFEAVQKAISLLKNEREKRIKPFRDEKILTDWNGLMIAALAYAGRIINEPAFIQAAEKAAGFILQYHGVNANELFHRSMSKEAGIPGMLEDYAFFIWALLELYQSTFKLEYLKKADALTDRLITNFKDNESAGFMFTDKAYMQVPVNQKELYDGAIPSANSVMVTNLVTLSHLTGDAGYDHEATLTLRAFSEIVEKAPASFTHYLNGLMHALHSHTEIVIASPANNPSVKRFLREVYAVYNPYVFVLLKDTDSDTTDLNTLAPFTEGMRALDNEPTYYICKDFACEMPHTRLEQALEAINS